MGILSNPNSILAIGFVIRFLIPTLVPNITSLLDQNVLFSTPVNSYRSLQEGLFLITNNLNPYKEGEILHQPPLVLLYFILINNNEIIINLTFALIDTLIGWSLIRINENYKNENDKKIKNTRYSSLIIALFYVSNPLSILSTLAKSTNQITNLVVVLMINSLLTNNYSFSLSLLSLAGYLDFNSWYLIVPVLTWIYIKHDSSTATRGSKNVLIIKCLLYCLTTITMLFFASYKLSSDSFNFLKLNYESIIRFKKITPNLGIWWYFFTEIFEFFSDFYLVVFNLYSLIFIIPLTIKFQNDLVFGIWITIGFITFTRPYPVIADLGLFYSMLMIFRRYFSKLKFSPLIDYLSLFIILLLLPVFYRVWMISNSGNANFFYAIGLVLSLIETIILSDFIWSKIQIDWCLENDIDVEQNVKLTQI